MAFHKQRLVFCFDHSIILCDLHAHWPQTGCCSTDILMVLDWVFRINALLFSNRWCALNWFSIRLSGCKLNRAASRLSSRSAVDLSSYQTPMPWDWDANEEQYSGFSNLVVCMYDPVLWSWCKYVGPLARKNYIYVMCFGAWDQNILQKREL